MRIIHLARTPLAGSPLRLARAMQAVGHDARLVVLDPHIYGARTFPMDLVWSKDRDAAMELFREADVLHFHHYFDLRQNPFGVDFTRFKGMPVRQFHTHPLTLAEGASGRAREIVESPVRQLVISQFQARFYPRASIVPNLVPLHDPVFTPIDDYSRATLIFSPTTRASAYRARWDTKGQPEVLPLLRSLPLDRLHLVRKLPWEKCHELRRRSTMAVDDIVTGSHHQSALDSAALGLVTFNYVDPLTQRALSHVTGASDNPFVSVPLVQFEPRVRAFAAVPGLRQEFGVRAATWMRRHYDPLVLVRFYFEAYAAPQPNPLARLPARIYATVDAAPRLPGRLKHRLQSVWRYLLWPIMALRRLGRQA